MKLEILDPRSISANRRAGVRAAAVALSVVAASSAVAQPAPGFSGVNCSMTNCDCSCIAAEQNKGATAITRLEIDLPNVLTVAPGRLPPRAALARLELLNRKIGEFQLALQVVQNNPAGPMALAEVRTALAVEFNGLQLPPPPSGWDYDERYLDSLASSIRSELSRASEAVENQTYIEKEIHTCRQWADHKQCDPSLGVAANAPLLPAPPRTMDPPPTAETPPRQLPPAEGPLPVGRHPDGRPYMNDELISRYVAASQAKFREGGAYWRQGRMGQADYDEIGKRALEWFRYKDLPERLQRFDNTEIEALTRRGAEVTKAYYDDW